MTTVNTAIAGTLLPDGTVLLDSMPELAPGRASVVVEECSPVGWWAAIKSMRVQREANGYAFLNEIEMTQLIEHLWDEIDDFRS